MQITNFQSNVGSGGFNDTSIYYGIRGSQMTLDFTPFKVHPDGQNEDGVRVDFDFGLNGASKQHYSFDRTYLNNLLGKDSGEVETVEEMVTLLRSLLQEDWPDLIIEPTSGGDISMRSDKAVDRLSGMRTYIGFTGVTVNIEPLGEQNFLDIDIVDKPSWIDRYIGYIEIVSADVIDAGATLGAIKTRIDQQEQYVSMLRDTIDEGVSRLVDADMEEASARLAALQTQQQLAVQALQIANSGSQNIMQLFN